MKKSIIGVILLAWLMSAPAWATIIVSFDPSDSVVDIGDIFDVDIVADIPDPVLGWGLDVTFDTSVLAQVGGPVIGPSWLPAFAPDGDGLAGFAPFPTSVSGMGVLLATLTFEAIGSGAFNLLASTTPGDLTEGFPLPFPAPPGSFADFTSVPGSVEVTSVASAVPEPGTFALVSPFLALWAFSGWRQRRKWSAQV